MRDYPLIPEARYENPEFSLRLPLRAPLLNPQTLVVLCTYIPEALYASYISSAHSGAPPQRYAHNRVSALDSVLRKYARFDAGADYDLIVVDNASPMGGLKEFLNRYDVALLSRENTYFSFGAYREAWDLFGNSYDYFVFHEMDWMPSGDGWLRTLIDLWESDSEIGMIGNLIEYRKWVHQPETQEDHSNNAFIRVINSKRELHYNLDSEYLFTDKTVLRRMDEVRWLLFPCFPQADLSPAYNELAFQQPILESSYKLRCFNDGEHTMFYATYNRDFPPQWDHGIGKLTPFIPQQTELFIPEYRKFYGMEINEEQDMAKLNDIQRIDKVHDLDTMLRFFWKEWREDLTKDYNHGNLFAVILYGLSDEDTMVAKSGCVVKTHDGIATLYYLTTEGPYRNQGLATAVVRQAAEWVYPNLIVARYRNDENHIAKLFSNAGYRIIHRGLDAFVIVAH